MGMTGSTARLCGSNSPHTVLALALAGQDIALGRWGKRMGFFSHERSLRQRMLAAAEVDSKAPVCRARWYAARQHHA